MECSIFSHSHGEILHAVEMHALARAQVSQFTRTRINRM
jgi:hypothetical protein